MKCACLHCFLVLLHPIQIASPIFVGMALGLNTQPVDDSHPHVGYENPLFATLEVDYEDSDRDPTGEAFERAEKVSWPFPPISSTEDTDLHLTQLLTYYELDLGLNHVVRKWSTAVDLRSNHLVQVPGGFNQNSDRWEGPSGVLVCSEDYITYKHNEGEDHRLPIPRRKNPVEVESERRGTIIVASVCHRMKASFFFLLQTEDGDLFKVTIDHKEEVMQKEMILEVVISILEGMNPRILETKLRTYLFDSKPAAPSGKTGEATA